jgi:hypothetical protein
MNDNSDKSAGTFSDKKNNMLTKLDSLISEYDSFSKEVSSKYWRITGHHFSELRKMRENITTFTFLTKEEKLNTWVNDSLK